MQTYNKSITKQFELITFLSGRTTEMFQIFYELYPDGRTLLMDVFYRDFPLDTSALADPRSNEFTKQLFAEIKAAIQNNSTEAGNPVSELPVDVFGAIGNILSHFNYNPCKLY